MVVMQATQGTSCAQQWGRGLACVCVCAGAGVALVWSLGTLDGWVGGVLSERGY